MRREKDSLGELDIPDEAYYGIQTVRCANNYLVSDHTYNEYPEIVKAVAEIKKACAMTNLECGLLDKDKADAIIKAAEEVASGLFQGQFPVNIWRSQGTGVNMNVNEVIANRANEILTGHKGYDAVHPNTHVNMCQSSNDVFPTAEIIVFRRALEPLILDLKALEDLLASRAVELRDAIRLGRTGFQDAVPMTWGQVFGGWQSSIRRVRTSLEKMRLHLSTGVLGGTAVGTGMGLLPGYAENIYKNLSSVLGFDIRLVHLDDELILDSAVFDGMRNADEHFILMDCLKAVAAAVARIAQDILIFSSGPRSGIGELYFEPESKDKEAVRSCEMVLDVFGEVLATENMALLSSAAGQLDHGSQNSAGLISILDSIKLLEEAVVEFSVKCLRVVEVNYELCKRNAELSTSLSTIIGTLFGYPTGTAIAKRAIREGISCKEAALREKILPEDVCEELFDITRLTNRKTMVELIKKYRNYRKIS